MSPFYDIAKPATVIEYVDGQVAAFRAKIAQADLTDEQRQLIETIAEIGTLRDIEKIEVLIR